MTPRVLIALSGCAALAGCGHRNPLSDTRRPSGAPRHHAHAAADPRIVAAGRIVVRYATAALTNDPRTLRAGWRTQLALSDGELHLQVARAAPTAGDIDELRIDGTRIAARVRALTLRAGNSARLRFVAAVDQVDHGATARGTTRARYQVTVRRSGSGWKVTGFTVLP